MSVPTYRLASLTFEEAARVLAKSPIAFLPVGSTEAHGPHLPLDTDVVIAGTAAERAASVLAREDVATLVLPPIAYSVTEFAAGFGGTIAISEDAASTYVREVCVAVARAGFAGVVICNAHLEPGHLRALSMAAAEARAKGVKVAYPDITKKPHALRLGDEFKSGACHAGQYETSLVMAADPFLVRDLVSELPANPTSLSLAIKDGKHTFEDAGGPRAYFGDPAAATASHGDELYDELAAIFADAARELLAT